MKTQLDHKWQRVIARWAKSEAGAELSASAMSACEAFARWLWPEKRLCGTMPIRKPGWPMRKFLVLFARDNVAHTRAEWMRKAAECGISPRNFDRLWAKAKNAGLLDASGTLESGRMGWVVPAGIDLDAADEQLAADAAARKPTGPGAVAIEKGPTPRKWSVEELLVPLRANGPMRAGEWRASVMDATGMSASRFWQLREAGLVEGLIVWEDEQYRVAGAETVDL